MTHLPVDPVSPVPMLDLKAQYEAIREEIEPAILAVLRSQELIMGREVEAFEAEVATYCGARHAIGCSSGTDALLLALMGLGVGPGDEVITSTYSFFATGGSIARLGARPVFVDIDPVTFNIDPALIESAITGRTRAIMPVHLYGQCADMDPILEIARRAGLAVVEDAAQAIGAEDRGRRAGSMGTAGCFSFYPSKNLGAMGDAGLITTNDPDLAHKLRVLRVHGAEQKYYHRWVGGNFRLDAIHAAALRVKLRHLDKWSGLRLEHAMDYDRLFREAGIAGNQVTPPPRSAHRHVVNQYVIMAERRDELQSHLTQQKIGTAIYYPLPLHRQECFHRHGEATPELPHADRAAAGSLALPIFPELTSEQRGRVVSAITNFYLAPMA